MMKNTKYPLNTLTHILLADVQQPENTKVFIESLGFAGWLEVSLLFCDYCGCSRWWQKNRPIGWKSAGQTLVSSLQLLLWPLPACVVGQEVIRGAWKGKQCRLMKNKETRLHLECNSTELYMNFKIRNLVPQLHTPHLNNSLAICS